MFPLKKVTLFAEAADLTAGTGAAVGSVCAAIIALATAYKYWVKYKRPGDEDSELKEKIIQLSADVARLQQLLAERTSSHAALVTELSEVRRANQKETRVRLQELREVVANERAAIQMAIAEEQQHVRRLEEKLFYLLEQHRPNSE